MTPSIPAILVKSVLPNASAADNKKNSMDRLAKTNISPTLVLSVPKNIRRVKRPHINKYAAMDIDVGAAPKPTLGAIRRKTSDSQNNP